MGAKRAPQVRQGAQGEPQTRSPLAPAVGTLAQGGKQKALPCLRQGEAGLAGMGEEGRAGGLGQAVCGGGGQDAQRGTERGTYLGPREEKKALKLALPPLSLKFPCGLNLILIFSTLAD